jgi:geranylgeranyl pyrophosphate synthase
MGIKHKFMIVQKIKSHKIFFLNILESFLSDIENTDKGEDVLVEAVRYSLINSNAKYIRSFVVYEVAKIFNLNNSEDVKKLAIAIELMHAYSLVHDDLPGMDSSDYRRGKKSCHVMFGESTAILAGNAMQVLAFEQILLIENKNFAFEIFFKMSEVCGLKGILSGQVLDLDLNLKKQSFDVMNHKKTGVLFEFCLVAVCILADQSQHINSFQEYGKHLGLAYQMQDDLADAGEDEVSYYTKFQNNKQSLIDAIKEQVNFAKQSISHIKNNQTLLNLVEFTSKINY